MCLLLKFKPGIEQLAVYFGVAPRNSSRCKHCVAVLLKANRMRELPQLSSTDLPQAWGQHAKEVVKVKYAPTTLKKVPFCPKVSSSSHDIVNKKTHQSSSVISAQSPVSKYAICGIFIASFVDPRTTC